MIEVTPDMIDAYRETGDAGPIAELMMPMIANIARGIERRQGYLGGMFREDLEGFGAIGLMQALKRYDGRGRFISFAFPRIRGAMYDAMRSFGRDTRHDPRPDFVCASTIVGPDADVQLWLGGLEPVEDDRDAIEVRDTVRHLRPYASDVEWSYLEGSSLRELAKRYGVSLRTVSYQKSRTLKRLRAVGAVLDERGGV